jgi:hypothetical protein
LVRVAGRRWPVEEDFALGKSWFGPADSQVRHDLHWSWWRRHHQARARWFHQRARLRTNEADP